MKDGYTRKNVDLNKNTIDVLQEQADKENRTLKNYIELAITIHAAKILTRSGKSKKQ